MYEVGNYDHSTYLVEVTPGSDKALRMAVASAMPYRKGNAAVQVIQHDTPQQARDAAGRASTGTHYWGRFSFHGPEERVAAIRAALR